MTLQKLAILAHVSVSTASKAFSGSTDISEQTKQKVIETAKKYGCFEQFDKGNYHKKIIAIICPELISGHYGEYVSELEFRISQAGGTPIISTSNFKTENIKELFLYHSHYQKTDGLILLGSPVGIPNPNSFPAIALAQNREQNWICVQNDLTPPIREAIRYLVSLGHRRIAFLGETKTVEKKMIYEKIMKEFSLPPLLEITDYRFEQCGYYGIQTLVQQNPTAIIAAYDSVAIGAVHWMHSHGIRIPQDISLIGMDNLSVTSYLDIPLTTVSSHIPVICDRMLTLLWKKIEKKEISDNENQVVPGELIYRNSVAKPRTPSEKPSFFKK